MTEYKWVTARDPNIITAQDIKKALAQRHRQDLFFTEVKYGETRRGMPRIDALAIRPSYTRYLITGYEIKVSRSDFLGDNKWMSYLPMCHELFFCVAPGVINDISEVPDQCGLIVCDPRKSKPFKIVKKAPYREVTIVEDLYKSLLFKYVGELQYRKFDTVDDLLRDSRLEKYRDYLAYKEESHKLGIQVSKKLSIRLRELQHERDELEFKLSQSESSDKFVYDVMESLGMDPSSYYCYTMSSIRNKALKLIQKLVKDSKNVLDSSTIEQLRTLRGDIDKLLKENEGE